MIFWHFFVSPISSVLKTIFHNDVIRALRERLLNIIKDLLFVTISGTDRLLLFHFWHPSLMDSSYLFYGKLFNNIRCDRKNEVCSTLLFSDKTESLNS